MGEDSHTSATGSPDTIRSLCARIPSLPPYEAARAYRDVVRLEIGHLRERLPRGRPRKQYEVYAAAYLRPGRRRHFSDHNFAQKLVPTIELIRSPGADTILDPACGLGFESLLLALQGKRVTANDCSAPIVAALEVRRDFYREILGGRFDFEIRLGNIMEPDASLGRYDVVYVQEAISHIHPAEEFVALAAARLLRPGGRLVVCDSNRWNPVTRLRVSRWLWRSRRTFRHYVVERTDPRTGKQFPMAEERLFNPLQVKRMMRAAGFDVEKVAMSCLVLPWMISGPGGGAGARLDSLLAAVPGLRLVAGFYTVIGRNRRA